MLEETCSEDHIPSIILIIFFLGTQEAYGQLASYSVKLEGVFHGWELNHQPFHLVLSTSPLSSGTLRSSHTIRHSLLPSILILLKYDTHDATCKVERDEPLLNHLNIEGILYIPNFSFHAWLHQMIIHWPTYLVIECNFGQRYTTHMNCIWDPFNFATHFENDFGSKCPL